MSKHTPEASNKEEILPKRPSAIFHALEIEERKIERRRDSIVRHYTEAIAKVNAELAELSHEKTAAMERLLEQSKLSH